MTVTIHPTSLTHGNTYHRGEKQQKREGKSIMVGFNVDGEASQQSNARVCLGWIPYRDHAL